MPDSFKQRLIKQLIISAVLIVLITTVIMLLNHDMNKRMSRIEAHQKGLTTQSEAILIMSDLKKESEQAADYAATLEALLPTRDQLISFPRELEQIAKMYNVDIGFGFGNETPSEGNMPGSIRFTMSLGGSLNDILSFLKIFETSRYFINLSSVDLTYKKENKKFGLTTTGEVYTR